MKAELEQLIGASAASLVGTLLPEAPSAAQIVVERTRDPAHGDFSCNLAMRLARAAGRPPRDIATALVRALPASALVAKAEVAGAGFINIFLAAGTQADVIPTILQQGDAFGHSQAGAGQTLLLEFVSANPTGPLHVGHGRQAAYGATLANLLRATGATVATEYYINDAGRQMDILAVSAWLRYLQRCGQTLDFPSNGYRGDYVYEIADELLRTQARSLYVEHQALVADLPPDEPAGDKEKHIDALIARMRALIGSAGFDQVQQLALAQMLSNIREDLGAFGVHFDRWYSERELGTSGAVQHAIDCLRQHDCLYQKDGATWFRSSRFGDDEDRVLIRANGQHTYFAPDIAYHLQKRERGFDRLIDVLGADHHGYVARVRGALVAMGHPPDCLEACLIQFVSLFRGGEKIPMGKREAQFVTLRQLRTEVGNDACRLFYLMRSHDQHLDFDLELAKSRSNENPVYYIQYAHARVASIMRQLESRQLQFDQSLGLANLSRLDSAHDQAVLRELVRLPEVVSHAATTRAPHALVHFMRELATTFHAWYNAATVLVEEPELRNARLALALATRQALRNGLKLLGVSAPDTM